MMLKTFYLKCFYLQSNSRGGVRHFCFIFAILILSNIFYKFVLNKSHFECFALKQFSLTKLKEDNRASRVFISGILVFTVVSFFVHTVSL